MTAHQYRHFRFGLHLAAWVFVAGSSARLGICPAGTLFAQDRSPQDDRQVEIDQVALGRAVAELLDGHGNGIQASVWLGSPTGETWYELNPSVVRPTASAIKAFYLVELFHIFRDALDAELPGAREILQDDQHPAISHFSSKQREEIRRELTGASVRRIGEVMIGKTDVSNAVYNAAANLTTAVLGGPEELTKAIHERDVRFRTIAARRYMLRNRKEPGDNEATAAAFAALHQQLSSGTLAGVDEGTVQAIRDTLRWTSDAEAGTRYGKGGSLNSDPLTRVRAGWWETSGGVMIYVVMLAQPATGNPSTGDSESLAQTAGRLERLIVTAGKEALTAPQP